MSHKFTRGETEGWPPRVYSRCRCGHYIKPMEFTWQVEDEERRHFQLVERVKASLTRREPSIKTQRDYYLERANDPEESRENRALWQQLADELTPRVKDKKPGEQETLFLMDTPEKRAGDRT